MSGGPEILLHLDPAVHPGRVAGRRRVAHRAPGPDDARLGGRLAAGGPGRPGQAVGGHRGPRRPARRPAPGPGAGLGTRRHRPAPVPAEGVQPPARGHGCHEAERAVVTAPGHPSGPPGPGESSRGLGVVVPGKREFTGNGGVARRVAAGPSPAAPAECDKAPLMYEMKGASSGLAAPGQPVARLPGAARHPASARRPRESPVSRQFPRPRVSLGWCPFPAVKVFLLPPRGPRKRLRDIHCEIFLGPHIVHRIRAVIRTSPGLSTVLCTSRQQVTWSNS